MGSAAMADPSVAASVFKELDTDNDGDLSYTELSCRLADFGLGDDEIEALFTKLDKDGNGRISAEEFAEGFEHVLGAGVLAAPPQNGAQEDWTMPSAKAEAEALAAGGHGAKPADEDESSPGTGGAHVDVDLAGFVECAIACNMVFSHRLFVFLCLEGESFNIPPMRLVRGSTLAELKRFPRSDEREHWTSVKDLAMYTALGSPLPTFVSHRWGTQTTADTPDNQQALALLALLDETWGEGGWHSRRRDCHFAGTPSSSLLRRLLNGEGVAAE